MGELEGDVMQHETEELVLMLGESGVQTAAGRRRATRSFLISQPLNTALCSQLSQCLYPAKGKATLNNSLHSSPTNSLSADT